jgi:pimeloyl-ACP methyl ester carboxylesterase
MSRTFKLTHLFSVIAAFAITFSPFPSILHAANIPPESVYYTMAPAPETNDYRLIQTPNNLALNWQNGQSARRSVVTTCSDGVQTSGAKYRICLPAEWNGSLFVYAHGYVAFNEPLKIPDEAEQVGTALNEQGYAFATTSYSVNGLAVLQGLADITDLVNIVKTKHGALKKTYILGFSEGGLITTLAIERHPNLFDGGLAMCGPIGDFGLQINTVADFRVVFDYFYPNLIAGTAISVPQSEINTFSSSFRQVVLSLAIISQPTKLQQVLDVTKAPIDATATTLISRTAQTVGGLLWYSVYATNDAREKLGGQPYDNFTRQYKGSSNDTALNANVARFKAENKALQEVEAHYQTSGNLTRPLVIMHTTGDPIVPYQHQLLYQKKVLQIEKQTMLSAIAVERYGHCNFTREEIVMGVGRLAGATVYLPLAIKVD